ncbi:MAG: DUF1080 domain-containing protein [Calditrichaeota bacterium]|nr:MAG: DUF1080 domain-containing protein [Calditrichota bacterium]
MNRMIVIAVLLGNILAAQTEKGFHKYEYQGYDSLAQIPKSEFTVHQKDRPQPPRVNPADANNDIGIAAPSDAMVLFDGSSLEHFQKTGWQIVDGHLIAGKGDLITKSAYGDCQLHVEWRAPNPPQGKPNNMGNSGIFFMQLYELQVYDSYSSKIYADGSAAAIYGQIPPMVNVCRPPGQWQSYDVIFTAPRFENDKLVTPAQITVFHNGVVVHNNTEIFGPTAHKKSLPYKAHAARVPIKFQGHNSPVEYRNIWIRDLGTDQP